MLDIFCPILRLVEPDRGLFIRSANRTTPHLHDIDIEYMYDDKWLPLDNSREM